MKNKNESWIKLEPRSERQNQETKAKQEPEAKSLKHKRKVRAKG